MPPSELSPARHRSAPGGGRRACTAWLLGELLEVLQQAKSGGGGDGLASVDAPRLFDALATVLMRAAVSQAARQRGLPVRGGRLFEDREGSLLSCLPMPLRRRLDDIALGGIRDPEAGWRQFAEGTDCGEHEIGTLYEHLIRMSLVRQGRNGPWRVAPTRSRKRSGSFFTPPELARTVVHQALSRPLRAAEAAEPHSHRDRLLALRVCDPAMGAGVFLIEACHQLAASLARAATPTDPVEARRLIAAQCLYGVDVSALAVAVAEASLWLAIGDRDLAIDEAAPNLRRGDSITGPDPSGPAQLALAAADGFDWRHEFGRVFERGGGFDVVVGNPPWVAYAGRAAQPLDRSLRAGLAGRFAAWRGYPTLHGIFVERAAGLAPSGVVALLLPSPVADLDGYRATRRALTEHHVVRTPLVELGQDAFDAVTQPCFALLADPADSAAPTDARWPLKERQRAGTTAEAVQVPEALRQLVAAEPLPRELFGEMGFQSNRVVTRTLLLRAERPDDAHRYPLLEGRNVSEFREGPPRLFLNADPDGLRRAGVRLREQSAYARARFVVRQTAALPIAALHDGLPFRNSLLAGFEHPELSPELCVGLLNSSLFRALHLTAQRDARQAAFPQVKIRHLRALPRPPPDAQQRRRIEQLTRRATAKGVDASLRAELDRAVFDLFRVPDRQRAAVLDLLARHAPRLGRPPARVSAGAARATGRAGRRASSR